MMFTLHRLESVGDVPALGDWLTMLARAKTPMAITLKARQKKIALATRDDCWVIDCKLPVADLILPTLLTRLSDAQIPLITRNLVRDLPEIVAFFAKNLNHDEHNLFRDMVDSFTADLTCAAKCINQGVTAPAKFRLIEHDAYEVALLEPQYATGISAYYLKVAIPVAKAIAESWMFAKGRNPEWFITYKSLWLRVLAFFSQDPTLTWAFSEGRDVYDDIAKLFETNREQAETILLWAACGCDLSVFAKRFPDYVTGLPENLKAFEDIFKRKMPTLAWSIQMMKDAYWNTRQVETRYGRILRPGHPMGEAVAFRVFGTVEDILGVVSATFWTNRPSRDTMVIRFDGDPASDVVRVVGAGPSSVQGRLSWLQDMTQLSTLGNPLGQVLLNPLVTELPRL